MSTFPETPSGVPGEEPNGDPSPADPQGAPADAVDTQGPPADAAYVPYLPPAEVVAPDASMPLPSPPDPDPAGESQPPLESWDPRPRFPNFLDLALLALMLITGFLCAGSATAIALHFHLFGVRSMQQAVTDIHYTLGSQVIWYCFTFMGCVIIFPLIWHTRFMDGVEWRAGAALRLRWKLFSAAGSCFVLAVIDGILIPGPKEAPIDEVFKLPGAAWLLFVFGITLAPFFEELGFRGFLLPALCTAWDWCNERFRGLPARERDGEGKVRWSVPAMVAGSVLTSIPFAFMHAPQTGYSLGPFLLLVCVSLVLCWVRLSTRSLAASTLVHASYNLLLFITLFLASGGFRHLDKM